MARASPMSPPRLAVALSAALLLISFGTGQAPPVGAVSPSPSVTVAPASGQVATNVTLIGSDLHSDTRYFILLSDGSALASFTSSSAGAVPTAPAPAFSWPPMPASPGTELGDPETVCVSSTDSVDICDGGTATFVLNAGATLNMTAAPVGHAVQLTGSGLVSGQDYDIVFGYRPLANGSFNGTTVGSAHGSPYGSAVATFAVPTDIIEGNYEVQLSRQGCGSTTSCAVLTTPLNLTTAGVAGGGACAFLGTSCFTLAGAPFQITLGAFGAINSTYVNNSNGPQQGLVYAVLHNSAGQTVLISTATVSIAFAGDHRSTQKVVNGLPSGTYNATVFAVATNGVSISEATSVAFPVG